MPVPFFNVLNGGVHSGNGMAFQEFMIAPIGASSMADAVRMGAEVYQKLKEVVKTKYGSSGAVPLSPLRVLYSYPKSMIAIGIGDEGGFAPPISRPTEALDLLVTAIEQCDYTKKVKIGIDPASQEFLAKDLYNLSFKDPSSHSDKLSAKELGSLYKDLLAKYPIVLLEDPFGQDDWEAWENFCKTCPVELVGDDLLATNIKRIQRAEKSKACNALLLKINQIGTITESIEA